MPSLSSPYVLTFAASGLIAAATAAYAYRHRSKPGGAAFGLFMTAITAWTAVYLGGLLVPVPESGVVPPLRESLELLKWAIIATIPAPWVVFVLQYAGYDGHVTRKTVGGLAAASGLLAAVVLTNGWHGLFWSSVSPTVEAGASVFAITETHGPLYWGVLAYVYVLVLSGMVALGRVAFSEGDLFLGQMASLLVGISAPLVMGALSATGLTPMTLDLTPVGFAVFGVVVGNALISYDMLEMVPATRRIGRDTVVQNMRDGVVVVDTRGRVVDVNPVAEQVLDTDRAALLDRPAETVLSELAPADGDPYDAPAATDGGDAADWGGELTTDDGRLFEAHSSALEDGRGRRLGTVVVLQDVTELRNRQQRLTVLNRVLRHNLRNDMNAIDGYATMLADQFDATPAQQVREVSSEVVDLADKAREIERVMSRRGETEPADAVEIAETVVEDVDARCEATVSLAAPDDPVPVPGRGIIKPALENVVENAAEHNDADDPTVEVCVERGDDHTAEFRVADDGPGIPPQEREVLLEGTETALKHGSGLGLWLVYWSVESLDGDIVFEDNQPRGSVVSLCVPTLRASSSAARATTEGSASETAGS